VQLGRSGADCMSRCRGGGELDGIARPFPIGLDTLRQFSERVQGRTRMGAGMVRVVGLKLYVVPGGQWRCNQDMSSNGKPHLGQEARGVAFGVVRSSGQREVEDGRFCRCVR